jgi:transposase
MDKGFFSINNNNDLIDDGIKFIIGAKVSLNLIKTELDKVYDSIQNFEHYNGDYQLYATTVVGNWENVQAKSALTKKRKIYIHLYYNIDKMAEDRKNFDRKLIQLKHEILSGKRIQANENLYKKYFIIKKTASGKTQIKINEEAVKKAKRYYGFFVLLSNEKMSAIKALELYRNKDVVEKAFGNLKERLNMRRTLVSSEQSLDGKLFVEFIALIYISYLKKQMQDKKLVKDYTIVELLDKLDLIECFERQGQKLQLGEILEKQQKIFQSLDITTPTSL